MNIMFFNRSKIRQLLACAALMTGFTACSESDGNDGPSPVCNVTVVETAPEGYVIQSQSINFTRIGNSAVTTVTDTKNIQLISGAYNIEGTAHAAGMENGVEVEKSLRAVAQNVDISESNNAVELSWFFYDEPGNAANFDDNGYYLKTDIRDLVLIYQGGTHRMDFNADQIRPYVVHLNANGNRDWLFDGFLFCEFDSGEGFSFETQSGKTPSKKADWLWLIDRQFAPGKGIPALDECITQEIAKIGKPSFKHKVVISMPDPQYGQTDWGELDGRKLDFNIDADRIAACKWYVDQLKARFDAANFKNIELSGFYWMPEKLLNSRNVIMGMSEHVHSLGKLFYWIPYFASFGYSEWKQLGFDAAYLQPTYFWDTNVTYSRLDRTCELAYNHHMGVEMEFDMRASSEFQYVNRSRGIDYMMAFRNNSVYRDGSIAYYEGGSGIYRFSQKTDPKDREYMDMLAGFIQERRRRQVEGKNPDFVADFDQSSLNGKDWNSTGKVSCEGGSLVLSGNASADTRRKHDFMLGIVKARVKILSSARDARLVVRLLPTNEKLGPLPKSGEMYLLKYDGSKAGALACGTQTMQNNETNDIARRSIIIDEKAVGRWINLECRWTDRDLIFSIDGKVYNVQEDLYDSTKPYYPQGWPFNNDTFYLQIETQGLLGKPVAEIDNVSLLPF